jgi:hypothetical protein
MAQSEKIFLPSVNFTSIPVYLSRKDNTDERTKQNIYEVLLQTQKMHYTYSFVKEIGKSFYFENNTYNTHTHTDIHV